MIKRLFKIIVFTYPISLIFLVIRNFFNKLKIYNERKLKYYVFGLSFIYVINLIRSLFHDFNLINILAESKVFILILILWTTKEFVNKKQNLNKYIKAFIFFSYLLLLTSILNTGIVLRYTDNVVYFAHFLSIYLGVSFSLLLIFSNKNHFIHGLILILLNASGTGILSLTPVILYRFGNIKRSLLKYTLIIIMTVLLSIFLFVGQTQRGRSVSDFQEIDRVVLLDASIKQLLDIPVHNLMIGNYLSFNTNIDNKISFEPIKEYILAENDGKIYPRNTHNEHIRLIFQFGILGWILIWIIIFKTFKMKSKAVFWALFLSGFTNMILSITPVIFILYILKKYA